MGERQDTLQRDDTPDKIEYRRMARVREGRVLGGVCTGLGRLTGIDPVVYRVGFAILVLSHGQGVLLYLAALAFMPAAPDVPSFAESTFKRWFDGNAVLTVLGLLLCVGVAASLLGGGVSTDAIAVVTVFGLVLVVAHARGVNLVGVARTLPERLQGHPPGSFGEPVEQPRGPVGPVSLDKGADALPPGMIDLAAYSAGSRDEPAPVGGVTRVPRQKPEKKKSPLTPVIVLFALGAGAAVMPMAGAYPVPRSTMIVLAAALAVVGAGMVLGGRFRVHGLAAVGTMLTLGLLTTAVATEAPQGARYGEVRWQPVQVTPAQQDYRVAVGSGELDLTEVPLAAGQRLIVNAELVLGEMVVTVPGGARVELDARVGLGDLSVDGRTISGPNAKVQQVMEAEDAKGTPPVIVLRVRSKLGDVEVRRA
ncbi:PspC domain-containing protein [Actinomadura hibisca]|uniref:PspC domain-containing protein n=1 Tax=Actinomadura hibisca TaxID=68565 RepID=UPI00082E6A69|nr:PspC domain-containing protein [Actinomadura hibisca]